MGFTGRIVVARADQPLSELAMVQGEVLHEEELSDGWRSVTLDGPGAKQAAAMQALMAHTEAPVLWAFVLDSDIADVSASTPQGVRWRAYLHEDTALEYGAPPLEEPLDEVVRRVLAWSAEAGLAPSAEAVTEALGAKNDFAEESFSGLLEALGVQASS